MWRLMVRQVRFAEGQIEKKKGGSKALPPIKVPLYPFVISAVLALAAWLPYYLGPPIINLDAGAALTSWGFYPQNSTTPTECLLTVNPNKLGRYRLTYRVGAIVVRYNGSPDFKDATPLYKSTLYDIPESGSPFAVVIAIDSVFLKSQGAPNFQLLLVPKNVHMEDFSTLRQAEAMGAKVIGMGGMS